MGVFGALMDKDDVGNEKYKCSARAIYKSHLVAAIDNER